LRGAIGGLLTRGLAMHGRAIRGLVTRGLAMRGLAIRGLVTRGLAMHGLAIRALAIVACLVATTTTVRAEPASKKDRARAAKSTTHAAPPRPGTTAAKLVNLYNGWTHEWLALAPGEKPAQATVDRFLRDHYTNSPAAMEPRLVGILAAAAKRFDRDTVIVVSAFRHPKYNLLLRKKGHQVARDSNHTHGTAVDFKLPGIETLELHRWAKDQKIGGVGLYLKSAFVHMDTGPVRYWEGE
jgi:uncharacterized protein YcbK (DUF882 family)